MAVNSALPGRIRVTFFITCQQARTGTHTQLFQGKDAQVAVQNEVLGFLAVGLDDGQRLDQPHLVDAGDNLLC